MAAGGMNPGPHSITPSGPNGSDEAREKQPARQVVLQRGSKSGNTRRCLS